MDENTEVEGENKEIKITEVHFKYIKDNQRLWNTEECRNYLYHLGLKPLKRCNRDNGIYKYVVNEEKGTNVLKDENQITIYYV
tara:strand:+ start:382 stop:630 length:249 start_codon:yes stop_codon:yes gene_type:complete